MSKMGIGSFFGGFAEGYQKGTKLNMEREKADRESQMFGLQKQQAELELEAKKREAEFQTELRDSLAPIYQEITAANQPAPEQNGLQGVQPAPQPLNLTDLSRRFADTSLAVGFKHGKVTLEQLKQARDLRTQMDKENVDEAVQTWLTTGDRNKVAEVFNKGGKFKFDPQTMDIRTVNDPDGLLPANVIVVAKNPDGTERQVFNYEQMAMAGISKDTYAQLVQSARTTKLKEKNDTFRTGMTTQATLKAAAMKGAENTEAKSLEKIMLAEIEGVLKSPETALNSEEQRVIRADIFSLARRYIDQRNLDAPTAYNLAMRDMFAAYGKPIPKSVQPAPTK